VSHWHPAEGHFIFAFLHILTIKHWEWVYICFEIWCYAWSECFKVVRETTYLFWWFKLFLNISKTSLSFHISLVFHSISPWCHFCLFIPTPHLVCQKEVFALSHDLPCYRVLRFVVLYYCTLKVSLGYQYPASTLQEQILVS
jgi:hypothetical protein